MRWFILFIIIYSSIFATTTTQKIKKSQQNLKKTSKMEKQISKKIDVLAEDIIKSEKSLNLTNNQIKKLQTQINTLQANSQKATQTLNLLINENRQLSKTKKELEEKIVSIIAEKFSFYLVADKGYQENIDSIIANEVLDKMDSILKRDFSKLTQSYKQTNIGINDHNQQISQIQKSLDSLKEKQKSLQKLKKRRERDIVSLKIKKKGYKKKLDRIVAQKNEIRSILENLKILKRQEEDKKLAQKEASKQVKYKKGTKNGKLSVKKIGSSYQKIRVKRYRGKKTISPLDSYTVKQKFGNYIIPIYNFKNFNVAVVLQSKTSNAKVRNVLNGKVIFAKDTPMSGKVVIVENRFGIHTIYSHLNKIAPTLKVGKNLKKGYVIGRVARDLTFEVTQKNYHINPLELIR